MLFFEDFEPGREFDLGRWSVSEEAIVAFARDWDPQFFHVDPAAARSGPFGGLVASGWHTGSIWMRLYADAVLNRAAGMGGAGIDEIRWRVPTRPGDALHGRLVVREARPSSHRRDRGTVFFETELLNQRGESALLIRGRGLMGRRRPGRTAPAAPGAGEAAEAVSSSAALPDPRVGRPADERLRFEDFAPGQVLELGERTLSEPEIVAFARDWDPQFFHVDPEAAREGPFGGLVASGWHTASAWVRMFVDGVLNRSAAMGGPGVTGLRFLQPTRPGARLRGRLVILDTQPSSKRSDRGTVFGEAQLVDDENRPVMCFRMRTYMARHRAAS